ncbi:MAG: helix-turn-helix domain-containing protein [Anaerolineales bacterium]
MSNQKSVERASAGSRPWNREEKLKDPAVRAAYDALEGEFALVRQLIDLRQQQGLSQRQLAKRAGMQQPTIARLEGGQPASLTTLKRVANALDAKVEVRLVAKKAAETQNTVAKNSPSRRASGKR